MWKKWKKKTAIKQVSLVKTVHIPVVVKKHKKTLKGATVNTSSAKPTKSIQYFNSAKSGRPKIDKDGMPDYKWLESLPEDMRPREEWRKGEPPLTEAEIKAWLDALAPTDTERLAVLRNLLRNANTDQMSKEDREICKTEIRKLQEKLYGTQVKTDKRYKSKKVVRVW